MQASEAVVATYEETQQQILHLVALFVSLFVCLFVCYPEALHYSYIAANIQHTYNNMLIELCDVDRTCNRIYATNEIN